MTTTAPPTPAIFPAWFAARQQDAWERYLATPAPERGDETWRFSNLKQLDFAGFSRSTDVPPADIRSDCPLDRPRSPRREVCLRE